MHPQGKISKDLERSAQSAFARPTGILDRRIRLPGGRMKDASRKTSVSKVAKIHAKARKFRRLLSEDPGGTSRRSWT